MSCTEGRNHPKAFPSAEDLLKHDGLEETNVCSKEQKRNKKREIISRNWARIAQAV